MKQVFVVIKPNSKHREGKTINLYKIIALYSMLCYSTLHYVDPYKCGDYNV